jgi:hypothetical protein
MLKYLGLFAALAIRAIFTPFTQMKKNTATHHQNL